jgi:hypothetical protein
VPVGALAARAADAAQLASEARALGDRVRPVLLALGAPARLGPDDAAQLEAAARLIPGADGSALPLRRPGLARMLPELERLEPRAAEIRAARERSAKWAALETLSTEELGIVAEKAARRGLFGTGLLNGEASNARARLAAVCPALAHVSRGERSAILDAVLRYRRTGDALLAEAGVRELAGSAWRGLDTPWEGLAAAARWQARVEAAIPDTGIGAYLRRLLLQAPVEALQPLRRLLRAPPGSVAPTETLDLSDEGVGQLEATARRLAELVGATRGLEPLASAAEHGAWLATRQRLDTAEEQREVAVAGLATLALPGAFVDVAAPDRALANVGELLGFADELASLRLPEALSAVLLAHYQHVRGGLVQIGDQLTATGGEIAAAVDDLTGRAAPDWGRLGKSHSPEQMTPDDLARAAGAIQTALGRFPVWSELARTRRGVAEAGLGSLAGHLEQLAVTGRPFEAAFDRCLARSALRTVHRGDGGKTAFTPGPRIEAARDDFRQLDREKLVADRQLVRATLLRARPPGGSKAGAKKTWTEMALLYNEFGKQKGFSGCAT